MIIKRLRVEEGFFDSLDIEFSEGLNVLIGGRGVGKTSIIELIRFALDVDGFTSLSKKDSLSHALAVLETGKVTVDVSTKSAGVIQVSRTYKDDVPSTPFRFAKPIIFSQKEIESVGLDSKGRLRIIDSFIRDKSGFQSTNRKLKSDIKSQTALLASIRTDIDDLIDKLPNLEELQKRETALTETQKKVIGLDISIKKNHEELAELQSTIRSASVKIENLANYRDRIIGFRMNLEKAVENAFTESTLVTGNPALVGISTALAKDKEGLTKVIQNLGGYVERVNTLISSTKIQTAPQEEKARELRSRIDKFNEGAGRISKELSTTRDNIAFARNLENLITEKKAALEFVYSKVNFLIESILTGIKAIFLERNEVAKQLTKVLSPLIKVNVEHLARIDQYEEALKGVLQGSGLRYNEIAKVIATNIGPQELLLMIYEKNFQEFSETLDIPLDRATRLLSHLMTTDLGNVFTCDIEDDVQFYLLDGSKSKPMHELSIGQRCTVALSIILENQNCVLLLDQPEDHLDNEFVAATLIKAISQRGTQSQTIISSHNANIPVLGNASAVVALDSNGRKGFVQQAGSLEDKKIVEIIEKIMEGGKAAFQKRRDFYGV